MRKALAPTTRRQYARVWNIFLNFMRDRLGGRGPEQVGSVQGWMLFVTHLATERKWKHTTITSALSAISYALKLAGAESYDKSASFPVRAMIKALQREGSPDERRPITLGLLQQLVAAPMGDAFYASLYTAMYTLMFFALLRIGEVCLAQNPKNVLQFEAIEMGGDGGAMVLRMGEYKHSRGQPVQIVLQKCEGKTHCPVSAMRRYLELRGGNPGPLFCYRNGAPVTRSDFVGNFEDHLGWTGVDREGYKSHSFRIGGACFAAEQGLSDAQIRRLGRWKSNAFQKYLRAFTVRR